MRVVKEDIFRSPFYGELERRYIHHVSWLGNCYNLMVVYAAVKSRRIHFGRSLV